MAIAKVILNGETLMDVTSDTVESSKLLTGETATKNDGTKITGSYSMNIQPLTVKSTNEEQVFDGTPQTTEINGAMLEEGKMTSGDSNTLTSSLVWRDGVGDTSIVIGQTYHLSGWFGTGDTEETSQRIFFDTDWVASSDLISISFTTRPGYSDDIPSLFDGSIEFTEIKLSSTEITIAATAPFVVFTGLADFALEQKMYLSVSELREACDGYLPVTAKANQFTDFIVEPTLYNNTYYYPDYASQALLKQRFVVDSTDWVAFLSNYIFPIENNVYSLDIWVANNTTDVVIGGMEYPINKIWDTNNFDIPIYKLVGKDLTDEILCTITIDPVEYNFKVDSVDSDFDYFITINITPSMDADGWNRIFVKRVNFQNKTVTPTYGLQTITADSGFVGLGTVYVNGIPSTYIKPSGTFSITSNGTYNISSYSYARVSVVANMEYFLQYSNSSTITPASAEYKALSKVSFVRSGAFMNAWFSFNTSNPLSMPEALSVGSMAFYTARTSGYSVGLELPVCEYIGSMAFYSVSGLNKVDIPKCKHIYESAFQNCINIRSVNMQECTLLAQSAFTGCSKLSSVSAPMLSRIGTMAFRSCYSLATISFPNLDYFITDYTFEACSGLSNAYIQFNNSSLSAVIGYAAFWSCRSLSNITISLYDSSIGLSLSNAAFNNCTSLERIDINNGYIKYIGSGTFSSCAFSYIVLSSVGAIGTYAFYGCSNLYSMYLIDNSSSTGWTMSYGALTATPISSSNSGVYGSIYVQQSLYDYYISATNWTYYSDRIVGLTDDEIAALDL